MKHEHQISGICGSDWRTVNQQERNGGYGVACMIAFLHGVSANLSDIAFYLGVTTDEITPSFIRLHKNGFFTNNRGSRKDKALLYQINDDIESTRAWCFVAAVAGGITGNVA